VFTRPPPLAPILSQMHPVHNFPHYFPKIHSNIILPSTTMSSEWYFPFRFSNKNAVCMSCVLHVPPSHPLTPKFPKGAPLFRFSRHYFVCTSHFPTCAIRNSEMMFAFQFIFRMDRHAIQIRNRVTSLFCCRKSKR
jgi:hypothetical protein